MATSEGLSEQEVCEMEALASRAIHGPLEYRETVGRDLRVQIAGMVLTLVPALRAARQRVGELEQRASESHAIMQRTATNYAACLTREHETLAALSRIAQALGLDDDASVADVEAAVSAARQRLAALEGDAYAPGDWICDICGYVESRRVLHVPDGSVTASAEPALPCPNDGQYLRRLTWRELAQSAQERAMEEIEKGTELEQEREKARADFWEAQAALSEIKLLVPLDEQTDGPKHGWAGIVERVRCLVRRAATPAAPEGA